MEFETEEFLNAARTVSRACHKLDELESKSVSVKLVTTDFREDDDDDIL